jgi:hypothetical protein
MSEIAAPVRITADERKRASSFAPPSLLKRAAHFLTHAILRRKEDSTNAYDGCAWNDSTEYDLNYDEMTGRRARRR